MVDEVKRRTGGREDIYFTSDEHGQYETAIKAAYGNEVNEDQAPKSVEEISANEMAAPEGNTKTPTENHSSTERESNTKGKRGRKK